MSVDVKPVKIVESIPYKIRDLTLSKAGRKRIKIAEKEMPGLMATRKKYGPKEPLAGKKLLVPYI